jgi:hypothetical protein
LEAFTRTCSKIIFPTNWRLEETGNLVIFMQDGAPSHFCQSVRKALNEKIPNAWIGRSRSIFWPSRSPELTDRFFLWGYVMNIVYGEKIRDLWHLWDRITAASAIVTPDMIQQTWHEIEYHLQFCRATNGAHIET